MPTKNLIIVVYCKAMRGPSDSGLLWRPGSAAGGQLAGLHCISRPPRPHCVPWAAAGGEMGGGRPVRQGQDSEQSIGEQGGQWSMEA